MLNVETLEFNLQEAQHWLALMQEETEEKSEEMGDLTEVLLEETHTDTLQPPVKLPIRQRIRRLFTWANLGALITTVGGILDDVPSALNRLLPKAVINIIGPFLLTGAGTFIFTLGLYKNAKELIADLKDQELKKNKKHFALQVATHLLKIAVNAAALITIGFLLTLAILAVAASITVLPFVVATIFPIVVPLALMTGSGLQLIQKSFRFHHAKKAHRQLNQDYLNEMQTDLGELANLRENYSSLNNDLEKENSLSTYQDKLQTILGKREAYFAAEKESALSRFEAKRELGFAVADFTFTVGILSFFIIGTLSALGATGSVSFGAIPTFAMITIAVISACVKTFEMIDQYLLERRASKKIDAVFENLRIKMKNSLFNSKNKKDKEYTLVHRHSVVPSYPLEDFSSGPTSQTISRGYSLFVNENGKKPSVSSSSTKRSRTLAPGVSSSS